jgi:hypothetical protein
MAKWEYLTIMVIGRSWNSSDGKSGEIERYTNSGQLRTVQPVLNQFGEQGWEMTGVRGIENTYYEMFFKRLVS